MSTHIAMAIGLYAPLSVPVIIGCFAMMIDDHKRNKEARARRAAQ